MVFSIRRGATAAPTSRLPLVRLDKAFPFFGCSVGGMIAFPAADGSKPRFDAFWYGQESSAAPTVPAMAYLDIAWQGLIFGQVSDKPADGKGA